MQKLYKKSLNFFYPSMCLHCQEHLDNPLSKICLNCKQLIEISEEFSNVCFEKISPVFDLYQDYLTFHSSKQKEFFVGSIIVKLVRTKALHVDYISIYQSFDEKIFTNSYKALERIVKGVAKALQIPYFRVIKLRLGDKVYDSKGLVERLKVRKSSSKLERKKVLIISRDKMADKTLRELKGHLPLVNFCPIALFG